MANELNLANPLVPDNWKPKAKQCVSALDKKALIQFLQHKSTILIATG